MSTKKVTIGYKFRIYPTKEQEVLFAKTFGCTRYVYNYFLNLRNTQYSENHISLSRYDCIKLIPPMKSCEETIWLKEVDSIALQSSVEYLDEGFKRFFEDIKKPKNQRRGVGKPKFKSKHGKQSYTTKNVNNSIRVVNDKLLLPKIGMIEFEDDLIDALKNDYKLPGSIAQRAFDMAWVEGHSDGYMDVLIYADQYGDFASDVLKSAK